MEEARDGISRKETTKCPRRGALRKDYKLARIEIMTQAPYHSLLYFLFISPNDTVFQSWEWLYFQKMRILHSLCLVMKIRNVMVGCCKQLLLWTLLIISLYNMKALHGPCVVPFLYRTPLFEWCVTKLAICHKDGDYKRCMPWWGWNIGSKHRHTIQLASLINIIRRM